MPETQWQILVTESIDSTGPNSISDFAEFTTASSYTDKTELKDDLDRFDAIIVRTYELTGELISRAENLKVIAKHGTGLDNIDIEAATSQNVIVCNTPHVNARSVAEHTFALLLAVEKELRKADKDVREGTWDREQYTPHELHEDVIGLFGCGAIGRTVATIAQGFEMNCVVYDPYISRSELPDGVTKVNTKAGLFESADIVSVHSPLTEETHHAISTDELRRFTDSGILVNTSRGEIIDEEALVEALNTGEIAGAGLDVFANEPPAADNPLLDSDNVVVTPHLGGTTVEALERMSIGVAANIRTVYEGDVPDSTVNVDKLTVK